MASRMTLAGLMKYAQGRDAGLLYKHMKDLKFGRADDAPFGAAATRGVYVVKKKKKKSGRSTKSGPCGRKSRQDQVSRGVLKKPSAHAERLHRGRDPKKRRQLETERRPKRSVTS